jgi:4-amino-4-deoxy-L-arabinose transferase-like glycosyltransferase
MRSKPAEFSTTRIFWIFVASHFALWTLLPILFHPNAPLDVVEQISWGREWQLGYYKHPPLAAWLTNAAYLATGGKLWGIFLLSQVSIAVCFWAVWKLAKEMVDEWRALAAVMLLEGVLYFSFTSPEFNPNVLELPMWALVALFGWRAVHRGRLLDWTLLGVFAGLGLWTKYYTGVLLLSLFVFLLLDREARRVFRTAGPYLTFVVTLLVFAPHLIWMVAHRFATITYAVARAEGKKTLATHFTYPINFVGSQLLAIALMIVTFVVLYGMWRVRPDWRKSLANRYLVAVALGPFVITLLLSLLFNWKLRSMWGTPLWSLLPLLMLAATTEVKDTRRVPLLRATAIVALILAQAFVLPLTVGPYIYKPRKALYPGDMVGKVVTGEWRRQTNKPLFYVVGDTWMAGNVAFYSPDRPSTLTDADPHLSPWIDKRTLRRYGAVIVWEGKNELPDEYRAQFPDATMQSAIELPYRTSANVAPAVIHWAIVPPESER